MPLYIDFVVTLAVGLFGIGLVLKVVIERLFDDWDVVADIVVWLRESLDHKRLLRIERREDALLEIEKAAAPTLSTRLTSARRDDAVSPADAVLAPSEPAGVR